MALLILGTVILLLTISACCCQCLAHKTNQQFVRAEGGRRRREYDRQTLRDMYALQRKALFALFGVVVH